MNPYVLPGIKKSKLDTVKYVVCSYFEIPFDELYIKRKDRHPEYLRPRQFIMFFLVKMGFTLAKSGSVFVKDHATVLHLCSNIEDWIKTDKVIERQYKELLTLINKP